MLTGFTLVISKNGKTAYVPGCDYSSAKIEILDNRTVKGLGRVVTVKIGGHKYWSSIGQQSYAATEVTTVLLDNQSKMIEILAEYEPRRKEKP